MEEQEDYENFFASLVTFLKANAKGKVRVMAIMETSGGDFWIQGMMNNEIWNKGMLSMAETVNNAKIQHSVYASAKVIDDTMEKQELAAMEVPGKKQ